MFTNRKVRSFSKLYPSGDLASSVLKMDDSRARNIYSGAGILCGPRKKGRDWRISGHGKGAKETP